jgi:hypothetical protein
MTDKKDQVGRLIWDVLVQAYQQGGRTKVEVPTADVLFILSGVMANVLSQVSDAMERDEMIRKIPMQVDMLVNSIRGRPNIHIASRPNLVLPH